VRAGLDAALHDLCGRRAQLPVYRLLGLPRGRVRSMRTVSLGPPGQMASSAARLPPRAMAKLKLGARDGLDADRVRAATAGPLAVDANGGWDLNEALALLPVLAACRVRLIERRRSRQRRPGCRRQGLSRTQAHAHSPCTTA
jgi:L-Ala-D/L-Glu epimerase / N-acetyl-D-glutamate racemase